MAKSSHSSAALEPNKSEGGLSHPTTPLPPSERDDGVSPPPSPSPFLSLGGGDLAVQESIPPTMEFDIDDYQAKRARSITIPNGFQHCDL
eukprot:1917671-Karenia_brevis.AAC.2